MSLSKKKKILDLIRNKNYILKKLRNFILLIVIELSYFVAGFFGMVSKLIVIIISLK